MTDELRVESPIVLNSLIACSGLYQRVVTALSFCQLDTHLKEWYDAHRPPQLTCRPPYHLTYLWASGTSGPTSNPSHKMTGRTLWSLSCMHKSVGSLIHLLYELMLDRDAMDYFRAVSASGEHSERALELTETIIRQNPAHYTVW